MFTSNPFAELSASISPAVMQTYVVIMALLVVGGTLFDVIHKGSAAYFFKNWRSGRENAEQEGLQHEEHQSLNRSRCPTTFTRIQSPGHGGP